MKDIDRYKLEKKYVPLVDKYSIGLFVLGIASVVLMGSNKLSIMLVMSYFLTKVGVYVYTTQLSVAIKIKDKQRNAAKNKEVEDELRQVEKALKKAEDVIIELNDYEEKDLEG